MDLELGVDINSKVIIAIVHSFVFLPSMYTYNNTGATSHMWLLLLRRFSSVGLCATPQTAAHQASPSLGFSRQEHWSGLPFPAPVRESEVAQSCPTLREPMDCSLPGSSVHGILQARVLEWGAIAFFKSHVVTKYSKCD